MAFDDIIPRSVRQRFDVKLGIALLIVTLTAASIGGWTYLQTSESLQDDVERELTSVSMMRADELDAWLDSVRTQTRTTSDHAVFQSDNPAKIQPHLKSLLEQEKVPDGVVAIHYLDTEQMTFLSSSSETMVGVSPADQGAPFATNPPAFAGSDSVHVTDPFGVDVVDFPVIAVLSPVPDQPNRAVVFMVDVAERTRSFSSFREGGETMVVNDQGKYVIHPDEDESMTADKSGSDVTIVQDAVSGESGFESLDESDLLVAYTPLDSKAWTVIVSVPRSNAYSLSSMVATNISILLILGGLGLTIIGLFVYRRAIIPMRRLANRADEMAEGDLEVDLESTRVDEIGRMFDSFGQMRNSLVEEIESAEQARKRAEGAKTEAEAQSVEAEEARQKAEALTTHLEEKASDYEDVMTACAEGDLSGRLDPVSQSDAMTAIADAFNAMIAELERTIAEVKQFGSHVSTAAEEVDAGAAEVIDASAEVSESVQEISGGASRQSDNLGDVSGQISGLSASAEEVAATVNDVAQLSTEATEAGQHGRDAAEDAIDEMDEVERKTDHTTEEIKRLDDEMAAIGEIVEVITGVAEQTNLLALNASIEAARTGEKGDGFAVVAEEIKRLAEETKESAGEIENRIESIQAQTGQTVAGMLETSERVTAGVETVQQTIAAVERIVDHVEETNVAITEITDATEDQAESSQVVVEMVDEVAAISQETTAEAQTVAAAAEEQTATLSEVSESATNLASRADQLRAALADFTVDLDEQRGSAESKADHPLTETFDWDDSPAVASESELDDDRDEIPPGAPTTD